MGKPYSLTPQVRIVFIAVLAVAFTRPAAAQVSTLCRFTVGPRAGAVQDYAPRAPLPVGARCQDGLGSSGYIVASNSSGSSGGAWQTAYIDPAKLPSDPGGQDTPVTCWAASIAYIFAYYDRVVAQDVIAQRYYPTGPHVADPLRMAAALNTRWTDSDGQSFTVRSKITDRYTGLGSQISNQDVVDALADDKPVFFANTHHAMVLVKVRYRDQPSGPFISDGEVWDPDPKYHSSGDGGIRKISGPELQALFAAVPEISMGSRTLGHEADSTTRRGDAEPKPSGLCADLKTYTVSAVGNFASIKGSLDSSDADSRWFKTTRGVAQFANCMVLVEKDNSQVPSAICNGSGDIDETWGRVKACFPDAVTHQTRRGDAQEYSLPLPNRSEIRLRKSRSGSFRLWIDAPDPDN